MKVLNGTPDLTKASTSYVERQNLTMRMGMRRFTRLTSGFFKKVENLAYAVSLHYMHYNFTRPHQALTIKQGRPGGHQADPGDVGRRVESDLVGHRHRCSTRLSQAGCVPSLEVKRAVVWATITPLVLVGLGRTLGIVIGESAWWVLAPSPILMGFLGGVFLGRSPWRAVFLWAAVAAAVLAVASAVIGTTVAPTDCPPRPSADCETVGYGIGAALIFGVVAVALVPGLSLGRVIARRRIGKLRPF